MKILLVDDEPHVIRAIQQLVDWDALGIDTVLKASSGHEALDQMELYAPEILLTDVVMPDMTGLDLIKTVHSTYPETKILMISGYSDFEYIHTAMLNGGMDYLLKPLAPAALTAGIRKARDAWEKEDAERSTKRRNKQTMQRISHLAIENLLEKYFYQGSPSGVHTELVNLLPELTTAGSCQLCVLDQHYCYQPAGSELPDMELIESTLREILRRYESGYLIHYSAKPGQSILFIYRRQEETLQALERSMTQINAHTHLILHLGISDLLPFPLCFRQAYEQAICAFFYVLASRTPRALVYWNPDMPLDAPQEPVNAAALFSCILGGDAKKLRSAVQLFSEEYIRENLSLGRLDTILTDLHEQFSVWHASLQQRYDGYKLMFPEPLHWADCADTRGMLSPARFCDALYKRLEAMQDQLRRSPSDMRIRQVVQYLEDNYTVPFSQEECAARFYMNREYLCRLFTKELGVSMVNYLNEIRIRHAKELLANDALPIKDIAHQVGYEDEKYFARQFKRQENATPAEYRARLISRWAEQ